MNFYLGQEPLEYMAWSQQVMAEWKKAWTQERDGTAEGKQKEWSSLNDWY